LSELYRLLEAGMRYNGVQVLGGVTVAFGTGQLVAVAGPNGAGKSTLLGIMAGVRPDYCGSCQFRGTEVRHWKRRAFAREVSFVPQTVKLDFPFTAEEVVLMGRTPHGAGLFDAPDDRAAVERAMTLTDTLKFRSRDVRSLSGGERQRVILASVLAQEPRVLLLDEPATFLDLEHQVAIYRLLRGLAREGLLVVAATHDLNLAATYADRVILLFRGEVVADAAPSEVLTRDAIRKVFGVAAEVRRTASGRPWILYGD
jgi:iron complex transport system ATP-binding protein